MEIKMDINSGDVVTHKLNFRIVVISVPYQNQGYIKFKGRFISTAGKLETKDFDFCEIEEGVL